jgi:hypothetical protein
MSTLSIIVILCYVIENLVLSARLNSDIMPPLPVVDAERFYRPREKATKSWKIRNSNIEMPWPRPELQK